MINETPDASGVIVCAGCGARLRKPPAVRGAAPGPPAQPPASRAAVAPASAARAARPAAPAASAAAAAPTAARHPPPPAAAPPAVTEPDGLAAVMTEIRALREGLDEILSLLRSGPKAPVAAAAAPALPDEEAQPRSQSPGERVAVRSQRRKTVLVIDDDEGTRGAAVAALDNAQVPVRAAPDGQAGLAAIAEERPDVIVLELGIDGPMAGKDVVNLIRASMEWIDIPIVLYTRLPVAGQKEARQVHGADDLVAKGEGAPEALVARVISLFRRG